MTAAGWSRVPYVQHHCADTITVGVRKVGKRFRQRAVTIPRSPEAGVARAISRPNPTEHPVINQPLFCVPRVIPVSFNPAFTEVNGCLGASWPSNTDYLSRL
ncbi:hypothetical protein MBT84_37820 [Streptomyces sp. MBT84]|uniref:hypothetical protein n=1 Tax=unclassified Streptomyces TaxID=2593676 RepID=UPI001C6E94C7|nr:hypothetical protein [Streptomyces sp. MBT84]MBW8705376.1 hypothetical protein [Streptomyces sp. MBT84]